jgi:hypothetical protein
MNRYVFAPAVALFSCTFGLSPAVAQTKPAVKPAATAAAAPATPAPAPAVAAKWVPPVKGVATVDLVQSPAKVVGKEIVTKLTMKNTSTGSINLLKVDQLWYDKKRAVVSSATSVYRKPFLPGEVIDLELKAPLYGTPDVNQMTFAHANGRVEANKVKALK